MPNSRRQRRSPCCLLRRSHICVFRSANGCASSPSGWKPCEKVRLPGFTHMIFELEAGTQESESGFSKSRPACSHPCDTRSCLFRMRDQLAGGKAIGNCDHDNASSESRSYSPLWCNDPFHKCWECQPCTMTLLHRFARGMVPQEQTT
jgi:hypothetical protein